MKQSVEEAAKRYADKMYYPADRGVLHKETQKDFIAGAKWQSGLSPWISVKDRLPDDNDDLYIVLDTKVEPPACGVCDFDLNINKWVGAGGIIAHPTHWMPIPKFNK